MELSYPFHQNGLRNQAMEIGHPECGQAEDDSDNQERKKSQSPEEIFERLRRKEIALTPDPEHKPDSDKQSAEDGAHLGPNEERAHCRCYDLDITPTQAGKVVGIGKATPGGTCSHKACLN